MPSLSRLQHVGDIWPWMLLLSKNWDFAKDLLLWLPRMASIAVDFLGCSVGKDYLGARLRHYWSSTCVAVSFWTANLDKARQCLNPICCNTSVTAALDTPDHGYAYPEDVGQPGAALEAVFL